ncbi:MAG: hypothetical protein RJB15_1270, partial [Pseudomonadota bacterium]
MSLRVLVSPNAIAELESLLKKEKGLSIELMN